MVEVSRLNNEQYVVFWQFNIGPNFAASFQCPGRTPTYQLTCTTSKQIRENGVFKTPFSVNLETVRRHYFVQDVPAVATAYLNGNAKEMTSTRMKWSEKIRQEFNIFNSNTNLESVHLTLILEFPRIGEMYLSSQFSKLVESGTMADVQFIVKGQEMAAHAAILSAASPVMAAMFEPGKFKEGQSRKAEVEDIEPEVFEQLLCYVYTGTAPKLEDETITRSLFLAADKYQMDRMKEDCEQRLMLQLNLENAIGYLLMAHLHSAANLLEASLQFFFENRYELWDHPDWKMAIHSHPELFYSVSCRVVMNT